MSDDLLDELHDAAQRIQDEDPEAAMSMRKAEHRLRALTQDGMMLPELPSDRWFKLERIYKNQWQCILSTNMASEDVVSTGPTPREAINNALAKIPKVETG